MLLVSGEQKLTEFNYTVNLSCDELDNLDFSEIGDVNIGNSNEKIKQNIRDRIAKMVLKSLESIGSLHIKGDSFRSSNQRRTSTVRATHFGGSEGKSVRVSSYLARFRLGIETFVDYDPNMKKEAFDNLLEDLWDRIKNTISSNEVCVDSANGVYATLSIEHPRKIGWNADAIRTQGIGNNPQTSSLEKSANPDVTRTLESDYLGTGFGIDGHSYSESGMDLSTLDSDIDEDNPMTDYDPVSDSLSDIVQTYQRYERDSVGVRKPTENEIETVVSAVHSRIIETLESEEPIYLDSVPEEWKNATCPSCEEKDAESLVLKFRDRYEEVIKHRLEQDFGLGSENQFKSPETTNLFVTENAEILIRPEEIISWVISISNHVETYCKQCHKKVGGRNHKKFSGNLVVTRKLDNEVDESESFIDESLQVENPKTSFERIDIEKELDVDGEDFSSTYRSITSKERKRIENSITEHLIELATRVNGDNVEGIYDTLHKRDNTQQYNREGRIHCSTCQSPVTKSSSRENLRKFEKHHIEPLSSNRVPHIINKIRELLSHSEGTNAEYAPVKVSEDGGRYLFSDEFISLVEILYRNVDTIALFCDNCESEIQDSNHISYEEQKNESSGEDTEIDAFTATHNVPRSGEIDLYCVGCDNKMFDKIEYSGKIVDGDCYVTQNGQRCKVPVRRTSRSGFEGLCPEHKRYMRQRYDNDDILGEDASERIKRLIKMTIANTNG